MKHVAAKYPNVAVRLTGLCFLQRTCISIFLNDLYPTVLPTPWLLSSYKKNAWVASLCKLSSATSPVHPNDRCCLSCKCSRCRLKRPTGPRSVEKILGIHQPSAAVSRVLRRPCAHNFARSCQMLNEVGVSTGLWRAEQGGKRRLHAERVGTWLVDF